MYALKIILCILCLNKVFAVTELKFDALQLIVENIFKKEPFNTIFVQHDGKYLEIDKSGFPSGVPILLYSLDNEIALIEKFNANLLCLVYLQEFRIGKLRSLFKNLFYMRNTKTILQLNNVTCNDITIEQLLEAFYQEKMLNVLLICENRVYTFWPFPQSHVQLLSLTDSHMPELFPNKVANLYGRPLRTHPDQIEPRTIARRNNKGELVMTGNVGRFIHLLAWKLNATLEYPLGVVVGETEQRSDIIELTRNGTLDIPGSVIHVFRPRALRNFSHVFENMDMCLMIPAANESPMSSTYLLVFNLTTCLTMLISACIFSLVLACSDYLKGAKFNIFSLLLNDMVIRGLLSQAYEDVRHLNLNLKFIRVLLFVHGLFMTTTISTHLQSLLTAPPLKRQLRTFDDVFHAKIPLLISKDATAYFHGYDETIPHTKEMYEIASNSTVLLQKLYGYNQKYAYPTISTVNVVIREQQRYFSKDLFFFSHQACYEKNAYVAFPLTENSIYEPIINKLVIEVKDYGLSEYWTRISFHDMVAAKTMSFKDVSRTKFKLRPLKLKDFKWIWIFIALCYSLAILLFLTTKFYDH